MQRSNLFAGTALALLMCAVPAFAQQKGEEKSSPAQAQSGEKQQGTTQKGENTQKGEKKGAAKEGREQGAAHNEGKDKGAQKGAQKQEQDGKGSAQAPSKDHEKKGSAQTERQEKSGKGTAQTPSKDRGTAQAPSKEQDKTGSGQAKSSERTGKDGAEKQSKENAQKQPEKQPTDNARNQSKGGEANKSAERPSERVQLSEQQRSNLHQTLLKERNVNRAHNVNISVSVGTRVPRSVHLAALPAEVISIVPTFRNYRYVVIDDQVCIVDPNSYEIVDVVAVSGRTARGGDGPTGQASLVLTEEEKEIVLRSVDMDRSSTLALGSLTEGSSVPRGANVHPFPETVVDKVPKLKGHKFFAAENRVAIVDSQGDKVQLVLDGKK
jgi:Protein of unknown function (DUF1236)